MFRNHTVVLYSMKDFFNDAFVRHGLCIFSECQKDGGYIDHLGMITLLVLVLLIIFLAILRYLSDKYLAPYLCQLWELKPKYGPLLPETFWKCCWSFIIFVWTFDMLFRKYPYYFHIETIWFAEPETKEAQFGAWKPGMDVPWDLRALFVFLVAFYAHGIFALYFQDRDRDFDYVGYLTLTRTCMLHHAATLGMTYLALVVPYVRIGVCVVFITQWCEFLLELMKIFNYVKDRADQSEARVFGYVSTGLFVALTWSWIWLKLHLFVTKVLYAAFPLLMGLKSGWIVNLHFPFVSLLNFALVMMWMMNWFWFLFLCRRFYGLWSSYEKKPDLDYGVELFSRFSSFHGWYIYDDDDD